jgi:hypothetical protein
VDTLYIRLCKTEIFTLSILLTKAHFSDKCHLRSLNETLQSIGLFSKKALRHISETKCQIISREHMLIFLSFISFILLKRSRLIPLIRTSVRNFIRYLGYGFHFQHRNSTTFPIESLAYDSGSTSVCAEFGYPKGSPNTNS